MNRGHVLKGGWAGVARGMEAGWPRPQRGLGAQHDSPATAEPALAQTDGKPHKPYGLECDLPEHVQHKRERPMAHAQGGRVGYAGK